MFGDLGLLCGAVQNLGTDEADHATVDGIHSNGRMQKQTKVEVIARPAKAAFARGVSREVRAFSA
jgi:hypothetical protein